MREGWKIRRLGDVCTLQRGFDLPTHSRVKGKYPLVSSNGITDRINSWKIKAPGVVTGRSGSIGNIHFIQEDFWPLNTALYIKDFHGNEPRYIYYLLTQFDLHRFSSGTGVPTLNRNHVHDEKVFVTTHLPEQKRIVAILDETFTTIAKAKANLEKNIQNSKELFECYLQKVFVNRGEDWEEKRFDEVCVLQRGFDLPTYARKDGVFPLVSSNGITDRIDSWKVKEPGVVTGRSGTIGNVHFIEENFWPLNTALYVKEFHGNDERCVYYFLKQFDLRKYSSGAGVPTLNRNNVHCEKIYFPKLSTVQISVAAKLDAISKETNKLEENYHQQLTYLEQLMKSLLQKAFNGELTAVTKNLVP